MELTLKFATALCYAPEFEINGVRGEPSDFGEHYDRDRETADKIEGEN